MTGVDADLATLRDSLTGGHSGRISQGLRALARVEAELSRLREERDEFITIADGLTGMTVPYLHERFVAAEARCARLQQALEWYADENNWTQLASWGGRLYDDEAPGPRDCGKIAREALAGPDTPADRQTEEVR